MNLNNVLLNLWLIYKLYIFYQTLNTYLVILFPVSFKYFLLNQIIIDISFCLLRIVQIFKTILAQLTQRVHRRINNSGYLRVYKNSSIIII